MYWRLDLPYGLHLNNARHLGWHVWPALVFTPGGRLEGSRMYLTWSVTMWWGVWGLTLYGPDDEEMTKPPSHTSV